MTNKNLMSAIAQVQSEAPVIKVDAKNPMYQGKKYATIKQIMDTINPLLKKNHLVFTSYFDFRNEQWGMLSKLVWVGDSELEEIEAFFPMERVADPQQLGKLATYARRYNLTSLLNLCFEDDDDDDDGNSFAKKSSTPKKQPTPINL